MILAHFVMVRSGALDFGKKMVMESS